MSYFNGPKELDPTGYSISIDVSHHKVHEGEMFGVTDSAILGAGGIKRWRITAPDTATRIHLVAEVTTKCLIVCSNCHRKIHNNQKK